MANGPPWLECSKIKQEIAMVHNTASRVKARELRERAKDLQGEARTLESIEGLESEAEARKERAKEQIEEAKRLAELARLEDIHVYDADYWKETKKGRKNYPRWYASWREGSEVRNRYLGSCKKMSRAEATEKARKLKAEALRLRELDD